MNECLMISGGPLDLSFFREFLKGRNYRYIVAVDNGFSACLELGIRPDLLVGDFDTFGRERIRSYMEEAACEIDMHKPEKDESDTELAFRRIRNAGFAGVDIVGALGGRLDHELSNIHLMVHARRNGLQADCYDAKNHIRILDSVCEKEYNFCRDRLYGTYVSFLPLTERVCGITLEGFKYPLQDKDISILENPSLCVSNEVVSPEARLSFREGILICIESRD